jgi:gamma-glutamyl-gamma-aminobutyrate hydrolase PuuD
MKKPFYFSVLLALLTAVPALACELPKDEVLTIGCSTDCGFLYRFRVQTAAWALGYEVRFRDLAAAPDLPRAMAAVDGILMPGGADIHPKYYLPAVSDELRRYSEANLHLVKFSAEGNRRDPVEYALIRAYSTDETFRDLPLLGICRGMQMMSVGEGIPLYLDIRTELGIPNRIARFDRISIARGTLMDDLFVGDAVSGFKLHHQGIRMAYYEANRSSYPNTRVTASSHDGAIAEALEYTHRPALGVQYHPERSFTSASAPVFRWFLTRACEHKTRDRK